MKIGMMLMCSWLSLAGEWLLPWVANKDGAWASEIAINNHSDVDVTVTLVAVRPDGQSETVSGIQVPAYGHYRVQAGSLFESLGSGSGYCVYVYSESDRLSAAAKISSTNTSSGDSPALAHAVMLSDAGPNWLIPFMPYSSGGASAPVLVNIGDYPAHVTLTAFGGSGVPLGESTMMIEPGLPFADTMDSLFAGVTESSYLRIQSDGLILGMAFNFNQLREPSAMLAVPSWELEPEDLAPLLITMENASTSAYSYAGATEDVLDFSKQRACPEVNVDVNIANAASFITADFDWGSGCTSLIGVYHSGAIRLNMEREGTIQTGGWMNGHLVFDKFVTKYLGSELVIAGETHVEGSTKSSNFTLSGAWQAQGSVPFYRLYGSFESQAYVNVNKKGDYYEAYGHYSVAVSTGYYASLEALIDASDPLIYAFEMCPWPTSGTLRVTAQYGVAASGSIDFGTGDCNTAVVTLNGQSLTVYLPGIYN